MARLVAGLAALLMVALATPRLLLADEDGERTFRDLHAPPPPEHTEPAEIWI